MDRRAVLAGAAALPIWLSTGFGAHARTAGSTKRVRAALDGARGIGKPLLVLIVPGVGDSAVQRGQVWGHYLAHLSRDQALDLALRAVTCAHASDLSGVVSKDGLAGVDETTWAVLLETDSDPARAVLVRGDVPMTIHTRQDRPPAEQRTALEKLLRVAIMPDEAVQKRRLEQCRGLALSGKVLGIVSADDDMASFEGLLSDGPLRRRDLDRWAALVRFGLSQLPDKAGGSDRLDLLADAVRIRLFEHDPDGATWMAQTAYCPPCGMGHVPPSARLFLKFYAT